MDTPPRPTNTPQQPFPAAYNYPPQYGTTQMPNIVINNSASASASAGGYGYGVRKRQSVTVHLILFFTTCGIGNYFYARSCSKRNRFSGHVHHHGR